MRSRQGILPGMPPPADDPPCGGTDPAGDLHAALDRLADIHRRQDALAGVKR